eukprot:m.477271 g.477271  ORF g.477271 m.477271 type:complete len:367 (+) comp20799_c0_seq1:164-1264(+)
MSLSGDSKNDGTAPRLLGKKRHAVAVEHAVVAARVAAGADEAPAALFTVAEVSDENTGAAVDLKDADVVAELGLAGFGGVGQGVRLLGRGVTVGRSLDDAVVVRKNNLGVAEDGRFCGDGVGNFGLGLVVKLVDERVGRVDSMHARRPRRRRLAARPSASDGTAHSRRGDGELGGGRSSCLAGRMAFLHQLKLVVDVVDLHDAGHAKAQADDGDKKRRDDDLGGHGRGGVACPTPQGVRLLLLDFHRQGAVRVCVSLSLSVVCARGCWSMTKLKSSQPTTHTQPTHSTHPRCDGACSSVHVDGGRPCGHRGQSVAQAGRRERVCGHHRLNPCHHLHRQGPRHAGQRQPLGRGRACCFPAGRRARRV